jgi:thiamine-monophosphate kinase
MTATPLGPGPEFDRIRAIGSALGDAAAGLGDDCAFLPDGWCVSTDLTVEGVHFLREWLAPEEIGWRAAAAALSDLAAVGASAEAVVVGLSARREEPTEVLAAVMRGVGRVARSVGARVVGGDLTGGAELGLAVTVMGRTDRPVHRSGARAGDEIWVTGTLGGARAALEAWRLGQEPSPGARELFARPLPMIAAGQWLARAGATAMIDVSDGLAGELHHLAAASGVGLAVELERLPLGDGVVEMAERVREAAPAFAARGGEDYQLLVTLPAAVNPTLPELTRIGVVTGEPGVRLTLRGAVLTLTGFDHFR